MLPQYCTAIRAGLCWTIKNHPPMAQIPCLAVGDCEETVSVDYHKPHLGLAPLLPVEPEHHRHLPLLQLGPSFLQQNCLQGSQVWRGGGGHVVEEKIPRLPVRSPDMKSVVGLCQFVLTIFSVQSNKQLTHTQQTTTGDYRICKSM